MKNTEMFIADFINSDFSKKNIYTHFQFGLPMVICYKEKPAVKLYLHHVRMEENEMIWSEPKVEVILSFPTGRLIRFLDISDNNCVKEIGIKKNCWQSMKYTFQEVYAACDDVLDFWGKHHFATKVVFNQCHQVMMRGAAELGFDVWYKKTGDFK